MSEGIIIALIGFVGAVLGAAIAGFATITAAGLKKGDSQVPCGVLGLLASLGAAGGLVLGAFFGVALMQQTPRTTYQPSALQPTQVVIVATASPPQPAAQPTAGSPLPSTQVSGVQSRAEMLVLYDSVYKQQGWCGLWNRLIQDNLVGGDCPLSVTQVTREDVASTSGTVNVVSGAQIRIASDIRLNYPACATFGSQYATYSGGKVIPWIRCVKL